MTLEAGEVDLDRVQALLGGRALRRLVERLGKRLSCGLILTGTIHLSKVTREEREAVNKLIGRLPNRGNSLSIDLGQLASILTQAEACCQLDDAVEAILGPITNRRLESRIIKERWEKLWYSAKERVEANKLALQWLDDLSATGLLKRLTKGDVLLAEKLLSQATSIIEQVPLPAVRLAELAALVAGDSHALDQGKPLASITVRFARHLEHSVRLRFGTARREAWEMLGVLCDEVSAPVLVLNLRAIPNSLTGKALNLHADAGEPYRLSVRQLRRDSPCFTPSVCGRMVFVCENPTVVDVAATRLGRACAPLICVDGQPKTASKLLLDALTSAGIVVRYHGDFDWDGLRIANTIIRRHSAGTWRFNATDYAAVAASGSRLSGTPVSAEWDAELRSLMESHGKCVHEENLLDSLLADLA